LLQPNDAENWQDTRIRAVSKSLDCVFVIEQGELRATWKFSPRYYRRATIEELAQTCLRELAAFVKTDARLAAAITAAEGSAVPAAAEGEKTTMRRA
jgi:hypothetical protein